MPCGLHGHYKNALTQVHKNGKDLFAVPGPVVLWLTVKKIWTHQFTHNPFEGADLPLSVTVIISNP